MLVSFLMDFLIYQCEDEVLCVLEVVINQPLLRFRFSKNLDFIVVVGSAVQYGKVAP